MVRAGPEALQRLRSGWDWTQFQVLLGASGGPRWLVLSALDRVLAKRLTAGNRPVHLLGSSAGAWRFAAYLQNDPEAALRRLERAYIEGNWDHRRALAERGLEARSIMRQLLDGRQAESLRHPLFRLHVVTTLCRGPLASDRNLPQLAGLLGAAILTLLGRRWLGALAQRALFSDPRSPLPSLLDDVPGRVWPLSADNLEDALLASGAIPLVLPGTRNVARGPRGCLRDGGLIDYHFDHVRFHGSGLILMPHHAAALMPSWLDRFHPSRALHSEIIRRLVLVHPSAEWLASLPGGGVPNRDDAHRMGEADRKRRWWEAASRSEELAEALDDAVQRAEPLPLLRSPLR